MNRRLLILTILTSSLSVAIFEFSLIHTVILLLTYLMSVFTYNNFDYKWFKFFVFATLPFLFSFIISLPLSYAFNFKLDYTQLNISGRLINIIGLYFVLCSLNFMLLRNALNLDLIIKVYFYSCVLMVTTAIWHVLDLYTKFPIAFPFETRSLLHSAQGTFGISTRLTGIAQEPSYIASILTDAWIFCFYLFFRNKKRLIFWRLLFLVILLFTFSPSAYASLLLLSLIEIFFRLSRINRVMWLSISTVLILNATVLLNLLRNNNIEAVKYIVGRFDGVGNSGRFIIISTAIQDLFKEGDIGSILFGNGFKSFQILKTKYSFISVDTSNSLYIDVLYEAGLIGLLFLLCFFIFLFFKINSITDFKNKMFAILLTMNLFISNFYRADYATFRYLFILFILYYLIYHNNQYNNVRES